METGFSPPLYSVRFPLPIVPHALAIFRLLLFLLGYSAEAFAEGKGDQRYMDFTSIRAIAIAQIIRIVPHCVRGLSRSPEHILRLFR